MRDLRPAARREQRETPTETTAGQDTSITAVERRRLEQRTAVHKSNCRGAVAAFSPTDGLICAQAEGAGRAARAPGGGPDRRVRSWCSWRKARRRGAAAREAQAEERGAPGEDSGGRLCRNVIFVDFFDAVSRSRV